jgi:fluoride exporter
VLAVVALGGAAGAAVRYGITVVVPPTRTGFPWATFDINVAGCLLIGVLMVLVTDVWTRQRLLRPFLGVGVLGGFTTFSTYVVDVQRLVDAGAAATALSYLAATVIAALIATYVGMAVTRLATARRRGEAS